MRFYVYLLQTLFFFFVSMTIVLKHEQFHFGFDALQAVMYSRSIHWRIGVE